LLTGSFLNFSGCAALNFGLTCIFLPRMMNATVLRGGD
jgi:hypothetical protein